MCLLRLPVIMFRAKKRDHEYKRHGTVSLLVGTGSPFPPVSYGGRSFVAAQTNNSYIFPGVGFGIIASGARRVTDRMFMAGAIALADMSATRGAANAPLLPPINSLRGVAFAVARKVAYQAQKDGVAEELGPAELDARIEKMMWVHMPGRGWHSPPSIGPLPPRRKHRLGAHPPPPQNSAWITGAPQGAGATCTKSLPKFSPRRRPIRACGARGAFSSPRPHLRDTSIARSQATAKPGRRRTFRPMRRSSMRRRVTYRR
jgi:hypothetical protein